MSDSRIKKAFDIFTFLADKERLKILFLFLDSEGLSVEISVSKAQFALDLSEATIIFHLENLEKMNIVRKKGISGGKLTSGKSVFVMNSEQAAYVRLLFEATSFGVKPDDYIFSTFLAKKNEEKINFKLESFCESKNGKQQ